MNSLEKNLKEIFQKVLDVKPQDYSPQLTPNEVPKWDSMGHLELVEALQKQFQVKLEMDEIIELDQVQKIQLLIERKLSA